ncbi:hypothetical protein AM424_003960 [Acinetobacter baumannii]|nr:hypothetical protein AM424_003960 [Acinetobacter baumannii]
MMQFKNKVKILGAKAVDFKTDDGRHYDHVACTVRFHLINRKVMRLVMHVRFLTGKTEQI